MEYFPFTLLFETNYNLKPSLESIYWQPELALKLVYEKKKNVMLKMHNRLVTFFKNSHLNYFWFNSD